MNNNIIEDHLENIQLPNMEMEKGKVKLRYALLTSSHWNQKKQNSFVSFLKGGENTMLRNRFVFVGILAIIFAIGGLIMTTTKSSPIPTPEAQAEEIVKKALVKVDQSIIVYLYDISFNYFSYINTAKYSICLYIVKFNM